jgi:hypothetical protein
MGKTGKGAPWASVAAACAAFALAEDTAAQGSVAEACVAAHADGQTLRNESRLLAAKERFLSCAQAECPAVLQSECATMLAEVEAALPSLVVTARDASGKDVREVQVTLDGRSLGRTLDGKPIAVDPGPHRLRAERPGKPAVEQEIVVAQGEKLRRVVLELERGGAAPPAPAPKPRLEEPGGVSPLVWIGFGIGGAGLIVGGITGAVTLAKSSTLKDQCPGDVCGEEQRDAYDEAVALSRVSTVALAIAGAGIVTGIVGIFVSGTEAHAGARIEPRLGPGWLGIHGRL